jgi:hypothetical protein
MNTTDRGTGGLLARSCAPRGRRKVILAPEGRSGRIARSLQAATIKEGGATLFPSEGTLPPTRESMPKAIRKSKTEVKRQRVTGQPLTPRQKRELAALAATPDDQIDTSDIPELPPQCASTPTSSPGCPSEQHPAAAHARRRQARLSSEPKAGIKFVNFRLQYFPFICYKQFTESRCVATPVVFVNLLVSSGI